MSYVKDKFEDVTKKVVDPFHVIEPAIDPLTGKSIKKEKAIADKAAKENLARQSEVYDSIIGRLQPQEALTAGALQDYLNYINDPNAQQSALNNTPEYQNYVQQARLLDTQGASSDLNKYRADLNNLAGSPEAQAQLLANNPAFNEIIRQQQAEVLKNQAASGKLGSGDTLLELQRRALPQGLEFVNNQIGNYRNLVDVNKNIVDTGTVNAGNILSNSRNIISDRENQLSGVLNFNQGLQNEVDRYNLSKVGAINDTNTGMANRQIAANQARNAQIQGLISAAASAFTGAPMPNNLSPQARAYAAANGGTSQTPSFSQLLGLLGKV